ncbi:MAG: SDR family NAD(P)-dependent oxidoreductase [Prevotellaceae bacterium]|nr:SDR family NAD(P)-dependent oxidoreductase [Prevotellaceae bacterium]
MENKKYKNIALISGVEPHRTILEKKLLNFFLNKDEKSLIVAGKPAELLDIENINNVTIVSHLEDAELAEALQNAENIYCRSGYSTLMDLHALGIKSANLIPTPGQTEQEYLAEHFEKKGFCMVKQNEFIIEKNAAVGKIAVVTGANGGFGFFIAKKLAEQGAKVVFACRNEQKARSAMQKISAELPHAQLDFIPLDLGDFSSVKNFAQEYKNRYQYIDILINNAGILFVPHKTTKDGFEQIFQTNYLGHFLLTNLLLPMFPNKKTSKIVTQSSVMYKFGKIHFDDLNLTRNYLLYKTNEKKLTFYSKWTAYAQSKLASTLFALELQRRLAAQGSNIQSVLAHPGVSMETNILKNQFIRKLARGFCSVFAQSADKGAMPAVVAALSAEVKGGDFIGLDGFLQGKGAPVKIAIAKKAADKAVAKRLWEISDFKTKIKQKK